MREAEVISADNAFCTIATTFGRIRIDESPEGWWTITFFDEPSGLQMSVPDLLEFGFNRQKELCEFSVNMAASYSILGRK